MFNINDDNKMSIDPYKIDAKEFDREIKKVQEFVNTTPIQYGHNPIQLQGRILNDKKCSIYLTKETVTFFIVDKSTGVPDGIGEIDRKNYNSVDEAAIEAFEKAVNNLNGDD